MSGPDILRDRSTPSFAMQVINLQEPPGTKPFSLFVLGFRPFFLAGGLFAVIAMLIWTGYFHLDSELLNVGLAPFYWHAHEMLFGFTMAVVSGFLLTAVKNWTGVQTLQHRGLVVLILLWLCARIGFLLGSEWVAVAAVLDLAYNLFLFVALAQPVWRVRQWTQAGILSKILLIGICNLLFYLGALGKLEMGLYWGLYGGLFVVIALVMTMGRRVMPFFIERGVGYPVQLKNSKLLDIASLVLFVGFALCDVVVQNGVWAGYFAALLVGVSAIRLFNWHTAGIWRQPLLWGLYVAFIFITLGFLLFAVLPYTTMVSRSIALHAFTFGGIGLITLSMMSRVTLGHTGRNIHEPLPLTGLAQGLVLLGALSRIIAPMVFPQFHNLWILLSQLLWISGFALFTGVYFQALTRQRIDGREG